MGIILIRVFLGLVLLTNGWSNVREHSPSPRDLAKIVNEAAVEAPLLLGWLGEDLIAAQPAFFAWIIRWGGLLSGILLLVGALVRPVGWFAGSAFLLAFFLGSPAQEQWNLMAAACCIACALTQAGRYAGLDRSLDQLLPSWLTWYRGSRGSRDSPFA